MTGTNYNYNNMDDCNEEWTEEQYRCDLLNGRIKYLGCYDVSYVLAGLHNCNLLGCDQQIMIKLILRFQRKLYKFLREHRLSLNPYTHERASKLAGMKMFQDLSPAGDHQRYQLAIQLAELLLECMEEDEVAWVHCRYIEPEDSSDQYEQYEDWGDQFLESYRSVHSPKHRRTS